MFTFVSSLLGGQKYCSSSADTHPVGDCCWNKKYAQQQEIRPSSALKFYCFWGGRWEYCPYGLALACHSQQHT